MNHNLTEEEKNARDWLPQFDYANPCYKGKF